MTAAIYARKSTDQNGVADEARSVARQVEHARAYAARQGWTVAEDHVYVDDGISGAEFANRPGFLRLMNALKPRPAFQVLVMSEESRLGREAIETAYALKQLITAGVRVFFYLEDRERTLNSPMEKAMLALQTMADELEREKARQRVYDAMTRKARAGHVTGGRVFGYRNVEETTIGPDGQPQRVCVRREIEADEAAVVRRIFELCAAGMGQKRIAITLNGEAARAPRSQQGRPVGWAPSSVREVLFRELYRGRLVWNKTQKRNSWGQARRHDRAPETWITVDAPDLRIVSDPLWEAAHTALTARRAVYLAGTQGNPWGRPPTGGTAKYLLSGLSRCGVCGGGMTVHSRSHGKARSFRYVCGCNWTRGRTVCANAQAVLLDTADAAVIDLLAGDVLRPAVVDQAIAEAFSALTAADPVVDHRRELDASLTQVDRELGNLASAIAAGGDLPALVAAVRDRQARRETLIAERARAQSAAPVVLQDRAALRRHLRSLVAGWRDRVLADPVSVRPLLETILDGRMVFTPARSAFGGEVYEVTIPLKLDRLFTADLPLGLASPTGFEPVFWP